MVASRDIKPGELIVKESPVVVGPRIDSVPLCLGCYKKATPVPDTESPRLCSKCGVAPICCPECEAKPCHSEAECGSYLSFNKDPSKPLPLASNLQIVMPLRCLLLRPETLEQSDDKRWENFMRLESHVKERRDTPIWMHHKEKVVDVSLV